MGAVSRFDLESIIARHRIVHFVETGTGRGEGLAYAARFSFRSLRSCESVPALAHAAQQAFASDERVSVFEGRSVDFLDRACREIPPEEPILFWLDAHFPGADYGLAGYGAESDSAVRLPLLEELRTIRGLRPAIGDVLLVDDLRIWIDGPFGHGNLPADVRGFCPKERDASFFMDIFHDTHRIDFFWDREGYVSILPREPADA